MNLPISTRAAHSSLENEMQIQGLREIGRRTENCRGGAEVSLLESATACVQDQSQSPMDIAIRFPPLENTSPAGTRRVSQEAAR